MARFGRYHDERRMKIVRERTDSARRGNASEGTAPSPVLRLPLPRPSGCPLSAFTQKWGREHSLCHLFPSLESEGTNGGVFTVATWDS